MPLPTRNAALVAALLLALAGAAAAQSYNFKWVGYLPPATNVVIGDIVAPPGAQAINLFLWSKGNKADLDLYCNAGASATPPPTPGAAAFTSAKKGRGFETITIDLTPYAGQPTIPFVCNVYNMAVTGDASDFAMVLKPVLPGGGPDTRVQPVPVPSAAPTPEVAPGPVEAPADEGALPTLVASEQEAAQAIYDACCQEPGSCAPWPLLADGAPFTNLCALPGSFCNDQGNLVQLNMTGFGMVCEVPTANITAFTKLEALYLDGNDFLGDMGVASVDLQGMDLAVLELPDTIASASMPMKKVQSVFAFKGVCYPVPNSGVTQIIEQVLNKITNTPWGNAVQSDGGFLTLCSKEPNGCLQEASIASISPAGAPAEAPATGEEEEAEAPALAPAPAPNAAPKKTASRRMLAEEKECPPDSTWYLYLDTSAPGLNNADVMDKVESAVDEGDFLALLKDTSVDASNVFITNIQEFTLSE